MPYSQPAPGDVALAARRPRLVVAPLSPEYPAILHAPLFAPDRHPGEAAVAGPSGGALDGYAALGAATGARVATAVISAPGGATKSIHRGETVEGWRLVAIDRARLTFERAGARRVLAIGAPAEALAQAAKGDPNAPATVQP